MVILVVIDCIMEVVVEGEKVILVGFGFFEVRECKEWEGCNFKIGDKMFILVIKVLVFFVGKMFKDKVVFEKK